MGAELIERTKLFAVAPVLCVADTPATIAYFANKLGFRLLNKVGDPPAWASLIRDDIEIMLLGGAYPAPAQDWAAYIYITDADTLHAELKARGADIASPPTDKPYNNREFAVRLPDGRLLAFGAAITKRTTS